MCYAIVVVRAVVGVPSKVCHCVSDGVAFSALLSAMCSTSKSPQAKHAKTDPCHGTPTMAHYQPPEHCTASQHITSERITIYHRMPSHPSSA